MNTGNTNSSIDYSSLAKMIGDATSQVKTQLEALQAQGSNISIADMFQMQMLMNRLSQLSEMSTSVMSASNSAISSMARNVKS